MAKHTKMRPAFCAKCRGPRAQNKEEVKKLSQFFYLKVSLRRVLLLNIDIYITIITPEFEICFVIIQNTEFFFTNRTLNSFQFEISYHFSSPLCHLLHQYFFENFQAKFPENYHNLLRWIRKQ